MPSKRKHNIHSEFTRLGVDQTTVKNVLNNLT